MLILRIRRKNRIVWDFIVRMKNIINLETVIVNNDRKNYIKKRIILMNLKFIRISGLLSPDSSPFLTGDGPGECRKTGGPGDFKHKKDPKYGFTYLRSFIFLFMPQKRSILWQKAPILIGRMTS